MAMAGVAVRASGSFSSEKNTPPKLAEKFVKKNKREDCIGQHGIVEVIEPHWATPLETSFLQSSPARFKQEHSCNSPADELIKQKAADCFRSLRPLQGAVTKALVILTSRGQFAQMMATLAMELPIQSTTLEFACLTISWQWPNTFVRMASVVHFDNSLPSNILGIRLL
eukprot:scaffold80429_cov31-Tisochrysis_lutea.AAC.2